MQRKRSFRGRLLAGRSTYAEPRGTAVHQLGSRAVERRGSDRRHCRCCHRLHRRRGIVVSAARRRSRGRTRNATVLDRADQFRHQRLREVESVANSEGAIRNIRNKFDASWTNERIGTWLETFFQHDYVIVFDGQNRPIYSMIGRNSNDTKWFELRPPTPPRSSLTCAAAKRICPTQSASPASQAPMAPRIRKRLWSAACSGRPAVIAAVAVGTIDNRFGKTGKRRTGRHVGKVYR